MARDDIYSNALSRVGDFEFDEQVVRVFPDMIARSVPGYGSILGLMEQLAARFVRPETTVWDLGCSLGACTQLIRRRTPLNCVIHAVDNSAAMVTRLRKQIDEVWGVGCPVEVHQADLREVSISSASLVILNLTLQFVPLADRDAVIQKIHDGLVPGGALLLSEKICFEDASQQELLTELHHDFKRANGYSDLEIAQKRTAIENRLLPEQLSVHIDRLKKAGFRTVAPWFQCFNFVSVLAVR
ncbi:MAG: carboxy-S-adenosyl-L-methionine synthase CmoA [Planctomycetaceae bacterium]|nr:carboxy-S-adenosyl-L-methionine synthase CmoA [Planctomycetaceae bacterium]